VRCEDVQELIPAYVLGALGLEDRERVEEHAVECPQCAAELRDGLQAMADVASSLPQEEPSLGLRERMLRSLPPQALPRQAAKAGYLLRLPRWSPAAVAAVVAALAIAGVLVTNLTLRSRVAGLEDKAERLTAVEARMDQDSQVLSTLGNRQADLLSMVQQQRSLTYWLAIPGTQVAVVEPTPNLSRGFGLLLMPPDSSAAVLVVAGLSQLAEGQSYQVWLLKGTERTSAGQFHPDPTGWAQTVVRAPGSILAYDGLGVTIESTLGSPAPSAPSIMRASLQGTR